ncbi:MAG: hypothetical protein ABFE01_19655, partial [Phycisphaerales bacterium]
PKEVDALFQWPFGKSLRLARQGKMPHVVLPDGTIRFRLVDIIRLGAGDATIPPTGEASNA